MGETESFPLLTVWILNESTPNKIQQSPNDLLQNLINFMISQSQWLSSKSTQLRTNGQRSKSLPKRRPRSTCLAAQGPGKGQPLLDDASESLQVSCCFCLRIHTITPIWLVCIHYGSFYSGLVKYCGIQSLLSLCTVYSNSFAILPLSSPLPLLKDK